MIATKHHACQYRIKSKYSVATYQELEESNHADSSESVCDERNDGSKFRKYRIEHRSEEDGKDEQCEQDRRIPDNWSQGNNGDTNEGTRGELACHGVTE